MIKLFFKKIGMTRLFKENILYPITVLQLDKTTCVSVKTKEKHGYESFIMNTGKKKNINKPTEGNSKLYDVQLGKIYEMPKIEGINIKDEITVEKFLEYCKDNMVDAQGITKGKGFSGVMKRHNFRGLRASHGVSATHRSGGSTGMRTEPGRTMKNRKMAGHYGCEQVTTKNLKIFGIDKENQCIFIIGSVPGANKSLISLQPVSKKLKKGTTYVAIKKK